MGKKILSGIIATVFTASTVATSVIPMTNYKTNLDAKTSDTSILNSNGDTKTPTNTGPISNDPWYSKTSKHFTLSELNRGGHFSALTGSWAFAIKGNLLLMSYDEWITYFGNWNAPYMFQAIDVSQNFSATFEDGLLEQMGLTKYKDVSRFVTARVLAETIVPDKLNGCIFISEAGNYVVDLTAPDAQKPTISGTNNFVVNVNNMLSKEEILTHISATDDTDGTVSVVIESSTYNPSNKKTGDYEMVVSASDKAGNKTSVTIKVKVVDIDKPVINGTTSYTRSYDNPISIEDIKAGLSVSDNYDSGLQLELIQDNYSSNTNKVGVHTVTFKAKDSSNNESDVCTVSITVEDKIKPVISGPTTIKVPSSKPLTKEEFKSKFTINDGLDGEITLVDGMITGFDTYLQNFKKVGNYKVTINSSDKNGNSTSLEVTIKVEDKIDPEIWFDDYFIVLEEGQSLTPEQIKEYASKVLGVSLDAINELTGEYDTNVAGTYKLSVKTVDGKEYVINLSVTEKVVENTREMKWYEYIYEWFLILFNIEPEYRTDSFWNFGTRWQSLVKVYTEHKILDNKLIK